MIPGPGDLLCLQASDGLVVRRREEVALAREEAFGRVEVTTGAGEVYHRPGPLSALEGEPFVKGVGFLLHPRHAQVQEGHVVFKAGWRLPWEGDLPQPRHPPPSPRIDRIGMRQDDVVYLHAERLNTRWVCLGRVVPEKLSAVQARQFHPGLVQAGYHYINPVHLRRVREEKHRFRLFLDEGVQLTVYKNALAPLLAGLGLARLDGLEGWTREARVLLDHGLRDWPRELFRETAEFLKEQFSDYRYLVESVLWQTVRMRAAGLEPDYNVDIRGYWYRPLVVILSRWGESEPVARVLAGQVLGLPLEDEDRVPNLALAHGLLGLGEPLAAFGGVDRYRDYQVIAGQLVGEEALFQYSDLGFEEPRPDLRGIASERPGVVVLAEKATMKRQVQALARAFGASWLILGGQASLLVTEFFSKALREVFPGSVRVVAYVDYDPWGWIIARAFAAQLRRYGVEVEDVVFLVRPERFTDEELQALPVDLPGTTPTVVATVDNWMKETGGVRGERKGIHSDHLREHGRLEKAMREETGLEVLG